MEDMSRQIHEGMEVYAADGTKLGKVTQIWYGTSMGSLTPSEDETCLEVHRGLFGREKLFLPYHIIASADNHRVTLKANAQEVEENPAWHRKPAWIS
jgi:hypothetical protein